MLYDVETAAKKLNVSKQSIYNKIKLKEYKNKTIKKAGKTFVDDDLLNLIKYNLKSKNNIENNDTKNKANKDESANISDLVKMNKELIDTLKTQLQIKDKQMESKDKQIEDLTDRLSAEQELTKNRQVLELKQHPIDIKALEEHFKAVDANLEDLKGRMSERQEKNKKGFFKNLFKK